jgi:hypothetical protein
MKRGLRMGVCSAAFLLLIAAVPARGQSVRDTTLAEVLSRAYSMLKVNSPDAARLFEQALRIDPNNLLVRRQLGYLYQSQGRNDLAIGQFVAADTLSPSDTMKMQIAYCLKALKWGAEADAYFQTLTSSPNEDIRHRATDELDASSPSASLSSWYTRLYATLYYDTRWETSFYQAFLQQGYWLSRDKILSAFGYVMASGDARSSGGLAPAIFSDNALTFGVGLKAAPFTGFQASLQEGLSVDLIDRGQRASTRGDFRAVAAYGNGVYAASTRHGDVQFPFTPFADLFSSVGYYSRYTNTIGYLQARAGLRPFEIDRTVLDLYVKGGMVRDSEKEYYNNILEGAVGARFTPNVTWGVYLLAEFQRGYYWDVGGPVPPYDRYFNALRCFLILDRTF